MEESMIPNLRSRSRSKTPLPFNRDPDNAGDGEHVHISGRKTPVKSSDTPTRLITVDVEAIPEEKEPEVFTSPPAHRTRNALKNKSVIVTSHIATSDYSSEDADVSPQKHHNMDYLSEEMSQNIKNYSYEYEQIRTSSQLISTNGSHHLENYHLESGRNSGLQNRSRGSPTCSERSNESFAESILADSSRLSIDGGTQHLPYKLYKSAGEYWNKYPKTDYTYSRMSKDRVELAPGQIAIPNMSRPSLHSARHGYSSNEDVFTTSSIVNDASAELRQRWLSGNHNTYRCDSVSDSDIDETDNLRHYRRMNMSSSNKKRWWITQIIISIWTTIVTTSTTITNKILGRDTTNKYPYYSTNAYKSYTTRHQQTSWFSSISETINKRKWWLLLILLLLPLLYWLYGWYHINNAAENKIVIVNLNNKPESINLSDDIINNIVMRVKESLLIEPTKPQIIERIVESSNVIDSTLLDQQQKLIDSLSVEIVALKASNKPFDDETLSNLISTKITSTFIGIFGLQDKSAITKEDITSTFTKESKDYVDSSLSNLHHSLNRDFKNLFDSVKMDMKAMKNELADNSVLQSAKYKNIETGCHCDSMVIKNIVDKALLIYDADKTGTVDYALESAGGQVISIRCTQSYQPRTAVFSVFGFSFWYPSNSPRTVLTPGTNPGDCWAFQGFPGYIVIKLYRRINVTGFSMEHTSRLLTPHEQLESAPKSFTVWGLQDEMDSNPVLFGNYEYLNDSTPLQHFPVQNEVISSGGPPGHDMVELRIENNHGNPVYTCLYRFRVHGDPIDEFTFYGNNPER